MGTTIHRGRRLTSEPVGYLLILPFYVFFFTFVVIPILINLLLSFTNFDLRSISFVGLKNYVALFTDKFFLDSLRNTGIYTFFTLIFTLVLSLLAAIFLNQRLIGKNIYRTCFFLPHVTSMVAVSMIWFWIYEPSHGILNKLLALFGIGGQNWLYDVTWALPSIIVMSVWKYMGYYMVIYLAGLQGIPVYLYEAAKIDGTNAIQRFINITLPMLRPVTFFLFVTGVINNFNVFEQVLILTNGGPMNSTTTVVHQIYIRAFTDFLMGYAAAQAFFVLIVVTLLTLLFFRHGSRAVDLEVQ
ncbi:MAG: sugar ABC transporter permease [Spirochaetaceae bacterium]|nr:MAG: sugar ABC transporter permease [Spirochaetaceae bacterium]